MFTGKILLYTMNGAWKGVQSRGWTDGHDMVDDKEQEMVNNVALFRTF